MRQGYRKDGSCGGVQMEVPADDPADPRCAEAHRARRLAAARGRGGSSQKWRLTERFEVGGAVVVCERRNALGLWKRIGPPYNIRDMGVSGLSFLLPAVRLKPGTRLRLTLFLPARLPIRVRGKLARVEKTDAVRLYLCGVAFTDYGADAWAGLCEVHAEHARPS